jgi:hypothetical protein
MLIQDLAQKIFLYELDFNKGNPNEPLEREITEELKLNKVADALESYSAKYSWKLDPIVITELRFSLRNDVNFDQSCSYN